MESFVDTLFIVLLIIVALTSIFFGPIVSWYGRMRFKRKQKEEAKRSDKAV
jgi:hypothetical protein